MQRLAKKLIEYKNTLSTLILPIQNKKWSLFGVYERGEFIVVSIVVNWHKNAKLYCCLGTEVIATDIIKFHIVTGNNVCSLRFINCAL